MTIIRDGKEYELTDEEIRQAHYEVEREYFKWALLDRIAVQDIEINLSAEDFDQMIVDAVDECMERQEYYGDVDITNVLYNALEEYGIEI